MKEDVEKCVKFNLIFEVIVKVENFEVLDEEVDVEFIKMVEVYNMFVENIK